MAKEKPNFKLAILTISDAGAKGERADSSGDVISEMMAQAGFAQLYREIVPDERELISEKLPNCLVAMSFTRVGSGVGGTLSRRESWWSEGRRVMGRAS